MEQVQVNFACLQHTPQQTMLTVVPNECFQRGILLEEHVPSHISKLFGLSLAIGEGLKQLSVVLLVELLVGGRVFELLHFGRNDEVRELRVDALQESGDKNGQPLCLCRHLFPLLFPAELMGVQAGGLQPANGAELLVDELHYGLVPVFCLGGRCFEFGCGQAVQVDDKFGHDFEEQAVCTHQDIIVVEVYILCVFRRILPVQQSVHLQEVPKDSLHEAAQLGPRLFLACKFKHQVKPLYLFVRDGVERGPLFFGLEQEDVDSECERGPFFVGLEQEDVGSECEHPLIAEEQVFLHPFGSRDDLGEHLKDQFLKGVVLSLGAEAEQVEYLDEFEHEFVLHFVEFAAHFLEGQWVGENFAIAGQAEEAAFGQEVFPVVQAAGWSEAVEVDEVTYHDAVVLANLPHLALQLFPPHLAPIHAHLQAEERHAVALGELADGEAVGDELGGQLSVRGGGEGVALVEPVDVVYGGLLEEGGVAEEQQDEELYALRGRLLQLIEHEERLPGLHGGQLGVEHLHLLQVAHIYLAIQDLASQPVYCSSVLVDPDQLLHQRYPQKVDGFFDVPSSLLEFRLDFYGLFVENQMLVIILEVLVVEAAKELNEMDCFGLELAFGMAGQRAVLLLFQELVPLAERFFFPFLMIAAVAKSIAHLLGLKLVALVPLLVEALHADNRVALQSAVNTGIDCIANIVPSCLLLQSFSKTLPQRNSLEVGQRYSQKNWSKCSSCPLQP